MQNFDREKNYEQPVLIAALILSIGMSILFWPGVSTWEVLQFEQISKLPVANDWKSPLVASFYRFSENFFNSTGPILVTQLFLFWAGLALIAIASFTTKTIQIIFIIIVGIQPLIWITEIFLWKEAWTLSLLCLSVGAMFAYFRFRRLSLGVIAVLASVMMAATRQNTILLTLPALVVAAEYFSISVFKKDKTRIVGKYLTLLFSIITTIFFVWLVNSKDKEHCYIWHHALLWDLAAISVEEKSVLIPNEFRKEGRAGSYEFINAHFTPYYSDPLFFYPKSPLKLHGTPWTGCATPPPLDLLIKTWGSTVFKYPWSYLRHRISYFSHFMNFPDSSIDSFGKFYYRIDSEYVEKVNKADFFNYLYHTDFYTTLMLGILNNGWIYITIFVFAGFGLNGKSSDFANYVRLVWLAGLVYLLSFAIIGSGAVLRYLAVYGVLGPAIIAGRIMVRSEKY